jgi:hypothetical protein
MSRFQKLRGLALLTGLALHEVANPVTASDPSVTVAADNAYIDALQGHWVMEGTLLGKPVHYIAEGRRVLQNGFLEFHMMDQDEPPKYEASVFIGFDPKAKDYVAHWLDRFGAAGARVVATGSRDGDRLILLFPYPDGAFRDTFIRKAASDAWSLLLEAQGADGSWSTFAQYTITRSRNAMH